MDIARSNYVREDLLASESFEEPASYCATEAPALCYHEKPDQPVSEPLQASNIANIISGFPPSFTEMLTKTNLSTEKTIGTQSPIG